jgi:beta-lactamase superfamily II metal-dependent hydrolase
MKLRVFQADKGDCLLLTSRAGTNILVDGGMADAFTAHVQPFLGEMARADEELDLVYISHIDQDHIAGVLKLLDNIMLWRVHEYRKSQALATKVPSVPRMPKVKAIWHNAFSMLLGENALAAEDLLAQSSSLLSLSAQRDWAEMASRHHELAYSISEAIRVSRRVGADQLAIPLNPEFDRRLILVREPAGVDANLGGMTIRVVGPFAEDVDVLKDEWNAWLRAQKATVAALREKARQDAARIGQATDGLSSDLDVYLKQLGNRDAVTAPNLASVMLLVEEQGKRVLLTGDGHAEDIMAGLEHHEVLTAGEGLHLDVLKFQHHGSEHNVNESFCRRVFADHYVFCGNGKHENPDLDAMRLLLDTNRQQRPDTHFKLWFSSSQRQAPPGAPREHMRQLTELVAHHAAASGGKVAFAFLEESSFGFEV